jgi:hypothetical protein
MVQVILKPRCLEISLTSSHQNVSTDNSTASPYTMRLAHACLGGLKADHVGGKKRATRGQGD